MSISDLVSALSPSKPLQRFDVLGLLGPGLKPVKVGRFASGAAAESLLDHFTVALVGDVSLLARYYGLVLRGTVFQDEI